MTTFCYQSVEEQTLFIDLPGTKDLRIKGILRGELSGPLLVHVHGRPGDGNERLPYLLARYLYEQDISSLRLFLYDSEPNTRNLLDCTLQTHADDFDTVVRYVRDKGATKVIAVGHSYGGLTILRAQEVLDAIVLWDPSHGLSFQDDDQPWKKGYPTKALDDVVVGLVGPGYIIASRRMDEEDRHLGDTSSWAADKNCPIKIIGAPKGVLTDCNRKYLTAANEPKEYVEIPGAGHVFDESDEITLQLFDETASWFKRYSQ